MRVLTRDAAATLPAGRIVRTAGTHLYLHDGTTAGGRLMAVALPTSPGTTKFLREDGTFEVPAGGGGGTQNIDCGTASTPITFAFTIDCGGAAA